ncbi:hypothetical protein Vadar_022982 [Vaccinium darrowii]|uniref:Uncharacterized protein n=1 Tax=Vaccinium darrowii TaxID=229202 RepID=A0ACB7ZDQ2_9ERIC|nr:hypothetical protein Vadar_022982 [Vaccinium darrowii]
MNLKAIQEIQTVFASDLYSRNFLQVPKPVGVDFRASISKKFTYSHYGFGLCFMDLARKFKILSRQNESERVFDDGTKVAAEQDIQQSAMESGSERELVRDVIDVESGGNMSSITGSQEIGEIRLKPCMKVAMEAGQNLEVIPLLLVREHQHVLVQKVVYRNKKEQGEGLHYGRLESFLLHGNVVEE